MWPTAVGAIGLGDIEVRSYLGEALNLRIGVIASAGDDIDIACFSVVNGAGENASATPQISRRDVAVSLVETRSARYLQVRSAGGYNEPLAKISIRVGCQGDSSISRDFILLLDPQPLLPPPVGARSEEPVPVSVANPAASSPAESPQAAQGTGGRWTVYAGDTLAAIATGIFPKSRTRRAAYIGAMRALNPSLGGVANDAPLAVGSKLTLPDLQAVARTARRPVASTPVQSIGDGNTATRAARRSAVKEAHSATPRAGAKAPRNTERFTLRLSGSEIDLSRSEGVSEETRVQLREKQLLLDADDQVAQLLSLKNTVRQLEGRLNDMQLKLDATAPSGTRVPATASAPAPTPTDEPRIAATPAAAVAAAQTPALTSNIAKVPAEAVPTRAARDPVLGITTTWIIALPLALLAAGTAWLIARRRRAAGTAAPLSTSPLAGTTAATSTVHEINAGQKGAGGSMAAAEAARIAHEHAETARDAAMLLAIRGKRHESATRPIAPVLPAAPTPAFAETIKLDPPLIFDDTPDRFDLDTAPATVVDFPLDADDPAGEDRIRRLRYMHERFPELATQTVSIDDTDSVINAVRLYYEEAQGKGARDKASELLNFAIEERPQEDRFWLAQFELYRLDRLAREFTELATKFYLLFSHTEAWSKVRHIGHELDPANPLFAAAGRAADAGIHFDPATENWLNAPMDFSVNALIGELRSSLFSDHEVAAGDFDAINVRLSAGSAPIAGN